MMKSRLFLLLWMCCSVLLTACENEDPIPEPPVAGSRTVLAYLAADHRGTLNNLSSLALLDLEEMRLGMAKVNNSSNMRLLVYIDTDSSPRLIELKNEGGKLQETTVKTYENRNSVGVAETLEVFNDVFKNSEYRAESYGLIYWSHGDGWIPNPLPSTRWVGQDTGSGTHYMNIEDLVTILSADAVPPFDCSMPALCSPLKWLMPCATLLIIILVHLQKYLDRGHAMMYLFLRCFRTVKWR